MRGDDMIRIGIICDGLLEVHFGSMTEDYTLCGADAMSDDSTGPVATSKSLTCRDCVDVVKRCRTVRLRKAEKELS